MSTVQIKMVIGDQASLDLPLTAWVDQDLVRILIRAATGYELARFSDDEWIELVGQIALVAQDADA